jgi:hypothetical protein
MKTKRFLVLGGAAVAILAAQAGQPAFATDYDDCPYHHKADQSWGLLSTSIFTGGPAEAQAIRTDRNEDGSVCVLSPTPANGHERMRDN